MERSRLKDSKSGASAIEAGSEFQMGIILGRERERERKKERERERERERLYL